MPIDDLISGRKQKRDPKGGSRMQTTPIKGPQPKYNGIAPRKDWEKMPNVSTKSGEPQIQAKAPSGMTFGYGDAHPMGKRKT